MHFLVGTTIFCLLTARAIGNTEVTDAEKEENSQYVRATFYQSSQDQWNQIADETKHILSRKATQYCQGREEECGMKPISEKPFKRNFTGSDVIIEEDYPQQDRSYLIVPLAMRLPKDSGQDQNEYLNKPAMRDVLENSAEDIRSRTGGKLVYVEDKTLRMAPDNTLNAVIIPIACVILIALIILAIIVRIRLTKKEHQEEADKVAKKGKGVEPVELIDVRKLRTEPSSSAETAEVAVDIKEGAERAALLDENSHAATAKA